MVVLAASICTKAGKAIVSRQVFFHHSPKLIGSNDQHTFVETDSVRYVYQPLEELFMVLITNKQSNILQDIDTLHLFARVVSEYCRSIDERELIDVFDEVVSMGYRESINLAQIRTITEMDSHDERIQAEIEKNKEKEAKDELKRKTRMMEMQKREMAKRGMSGFGGGSGFGSGSSGSYGGFKQPSSYTQTRPRLQCSLRGTVFLARNNAGQPQRSAGIKGMQLGKKGKTDAMVEAIKVDEGIKDIPVATSIARPVAASTLPAVRQESVHIFIEEKVSVRVSRDGGLDNMEIKGKMELRTTDPSKAHLRVSLKSVDEGVTQFTMHPNIDKKLFPPVLALRDPSRPFPTNQSVGILKWRMQTKDESLIPLSINCWPSPSGSGSCDVNIEYELLSTKLELRDVVINIPYAGSGDPIVHSAEGNPYEVDRHKKVLTWSIPIIDSSNSTGVLEFSVNDEDVGAFFPIRLSFASTKSYCDVEVADVSGVDGTGVAYSQEIVLSTEDYSVV
ncbi:hypothetical protein DFJ73DRAFT_841956 [Zopfochytrium polystomum]|nr:hypothetical protein DFJ73DRAFT_841956 [Zopfochytrium polystomum]